MAGGAARPASVVAAATLAAVLAISHHRQGSTISHEVGDHYSQAINLLGLGHAVAGAHDRPAALPHWRDALAILASLHAPETDEVRALVDGPAG